MLALNCVQPEAGELIGHPRHDRADVVLRNLICSGQIPGKDPVTDHDGAALLKHVRQVGGVIKMGVVDGDIVHLAQRLHVQHRSILPGPCFGVLWEERVRHQNLSVGKLKLEALPMNPAKAQGIGGKPALIGRLWKIVECLDCIQISCHVLTPPVLQQISENHSSDGRAEGEYQEYDRALFQSPRAAISFEGGLCQHHSGKAGAAGGHNGAHTAL